MSEVSIENDTMALSNNLLWCSDGQSSLCQNTMGSYNLSWDILE